MVAAVLCAVAYFAAGVKGLNERGCKRGPARLVGGAHTTARIAIEVFAEQDQILPIRICCITPFSPVAGPMTVLVGEKEIHQPACDVFRNFDQAVLLSAARWILQFVVVPIDQRIALQGVEEKHVHWEPDGAAPVAVAAKHTAVSLCRRVLYGEALLPKFHLKGVRKMISRESAYAMRRKELGFIKNAP